MSAPKPVVLCILDGWGKRAETVANAPAQAQTPTFDQIMATCPSAELITHGPDVGLPEGQMGNSEVGHMNIGAGRVVRMDLGLIDHAIETGSFANEPALTGFIDTLRGTKGRAHLIGVMSDGGVHGHLSHMIAAAGSIAHAGVPVVLHLVTDGRDVAPKSAQGYLTDLLENLPDGVQIGTLTGRYFAMDRDHRWDRVQTAFEAMVLGRGDEAATPKAAIEAAYARDITDEFIPASVIGGYDGMAEGDGVFCLNFRADRARELLQALGDPGFDGFERALPPLAARLGMVDYSQAHNAWYETVFPKQVVPNTLAHWVADHGLTQFHIAETEKYPHVTFFLNGGKEAPEQGEDRLMPASPKVATYDLAPEMSAGEVTDAFVAAIAKGYDLIVCNYANPDMVGHTGDLDAAIKACEAVDRGLARVVDALQEAGGAMIVTADHGNCETMVDPETGGPHTAHTLNPVPVAVFGGPVGIGLADGRLADLAPTLLELMGLDKPAEMTGQSLIRA